MYVLYLFPAVAVFCAIWSVWESWRNPRKILEIFRFIRREDEPPGTSRPKRTNDTLAVLSVIGYGIIAYSAINSALFFLAGYGFVEDGEWKSYQSQIAIFAAIAAAPTFSYYITDYAKLKFFAIERAKKFTVDTSNKTLR